MRTSPSTHFNAAHAAARTAAMPWPAVDLAAHHGSARVFHDSCVNEMDLAERLSQWTEWLDRLLARRFATSVVLVGTVAGLIAVLA